jgi:hypothetical protein
MHGCLKNVFQRARQMRGCLKNVFQAPGQMYGCLKNVFQTPGQMYWSLKNVNAMFSDAQLERSDDGAPLVRRVGNSPLTFKRSAKKSVNS